MNLQEVLTTFAVFLRGPLIQKKRNLENRGLSCQPFFLYEAHQYLNWLSKIEGISLKLKKQSSSYSGLDKSIQAKKT
jgi:hypothetical protein